MSDVMYPEWRLPHMTHLRRSWSKFLTFGILLMALGVIAVIWAVAATLASVVFFGWILIFAGIIEASLAIWARRWSGFLLHLLGRILSAFVGVVFVTNPGLGAVTLTLLLAMFLIVAGLFRILGSTLIRSGDWGWVLANGLISVFLGMLILAEFPAAAVNRDRVVRRNRAHCEGCLSGDAVDCRTENRTRARAGLTISAGNIFTAHTMWAGYAPEI